MNIVEAWDDFTSSEVNVSKLLQEDIKKDIFG